MTTRKPARRDAGTISTRLEEIREQVRSMIETGQLKPGERINEQALAGQLGVGRSSAREALRSLERTGLVRIVPNRGAEVCQVTLEEALDLYDIRSGLARATGRLAAARLSPADEAALTGLTERMAQALTARDGDTYSLLNTEFHRCLMATTRSPRLIEVNAAIESELRLYLHKGVYTHAQMQASHDEHLRLLEAVCQGRAHDAAEAFESHIQAGKQRMLDTIARVPRGIA
jgi:DNA-binding GntR family transcriptional regulator